MASLTRWTWVWASSGRWWWTGRPGVLQSMGSQSRTGLSDWTILKIDNVIAVMEETVLKLRHISWDFLGAKWRGVCSSLSSGLTTLQTVGRKGNSGKTVTTGEYGEITVLFSPWILPFSNLKVREKEKSHNSGKLTSIRQTKRPTGAANPGKQHAQSASAGRAPHPLPDEQGPPNPSSPRRPACHHPPFTDEHLAEQRLWVRPNCSSEAMCHSSHTPLPANLF